MDLSTCTVSFDGQALRLDTSEDAEVICDQLVGKQVQILILQGNTFNIEAAERIGMELANQPYLREAHFKDIFTSRGRDVVPEAMRHLLRGISDSGAQLTLLDLSDNAIGPIGAPSVIEFLNSPSAETLAKLYLDNTGLGPEGSTSIAATIPNLKKLREFISGRSRWENKGALNMSRALSEFNQLEVLKFYQDGIHVEGIKSLATVLKANKDTIREIDFGDNTIKAEGADALAQAISRAKNLKILRLDDALLQNEGFSIICDALSKSPSFGTLELASFEGNELHGQKIVDLIELTFANCDQNFTLDLLENEFSPDELARLECLTEKFNILVDDPEEEYDDDEEEEEEEGSDESNQHVNGHDYCDREDGEIDDDSGGSNGYVDFGNIESDLREVSVDFIDAVNSSPLNKELANSAFLQLISTGIRPTDDERNYQAVQILCEELGLMKCEQTRKKKPLARDAIVYIGKRLSELPPTIRDFFEVVVKNNDELSCGKLLFDKLEI